MELRTVRWHVEVLLKGHSGRASFRWRELREAGCARLCASPVIVPWDHRNTIPQAFAARSGL